jgi:hypothetical protein
LKTSIATHHRAVRCGTSAEQFPFTLHSSARANAAAR